MEEKKNETGSFLGNIGRGVVSGLEYATVKTDDLMSFLTGVVLMPAEYLDPEIEGEVIKYLDEQSGYRNFLVEDIKKNREMLERYAQSNQVKGAFLKPFYSFAEQAGDVTMLPINALTLGKGGAIANGLMNGVEYLYEQLSIYDKSIAEFGIDEYLGLGTNILGGAVANKFTAGKTPVMDKLYDDTIKFEKIYSIKTDETKAPLDKMVELNNEVGNNVDFKIQGEVIQRIDSGQTQSIPKKYYNGDRVAKTIDEGVKKRIQQISEASKETELENKYQGKTKIKYKSDIERDVADKGAIAQAMKPVYSEIELGQKQALGEVADDLVKWNTKYKKYDGIEPIADIIDETIEGISEEDFIKICQGKNTDDALKGLQEILNPMVKESVEIKSKTEILNKDEGFYIGTLYNKQEQMYDLYKIVNDAEMPIEEKMEFIRTQLKDIGRNVAIDENTAKNYELKKSGYYSIEEHPELLKEFYKDIYSTTDEYQRAVNKGVVNGEGKSLLEVAIKWSNQNIYLNGKEKYFEIAGKAREELSLEDLEFKSNFERQAMEMLESTFKGYEKPKREIMEDIISTVVDERSGYNTFKNKFKGYFEEPESKYINPDRVKDQDLGFTMEIKADGKVKEALKDNIKYMDTFLRSGNKLKAKKYDDLTMADKSIKFMKDLSAYKLLFGIRHIREGISNTGLINSGAINLNFNKKYSYIKGLYDMGKIHYHISKNFKKIIDRDLSTISNPYERMECEIFLRRMLENNYAFDKASFAKILQKGANVSGMGQLISDVHRITLATRFTAKALRDDFLNLSFENMSPLMRSVLKSNGITDEISLNNLKMEISKFKTQAEFDDFLINTNIKEGGKLKSIFEQFIDISGREFEPFEKDLTNLEGKGFISKLWLNSAMLFKRYSMGAFSRAWKNATTYYDSNDILRYKFLKNNKFQWDSLNKSNWRNTIQGFGRKQTMNFLNMSAMLWTTTEATTWIHGKVFGTSQDEITEAKLEALKSEPIPIILEGLFDAATNYVGYDVMFGGTPAVIGIASDTYKGLGRAATAENLETHEKIIYGLLRTISPSNVARGIDNLKLEKPINPRLITFSKDAQFLWKYYYKKDAELEQIEGEFPITKVFGTVTNWYKYFKANSYKAEEIAGDITKGDKEATIILASGIAELAEEEMRAEHINYAFAIDEVEEREKVLEQFGLDYKSQLSKLDNKVRNNFNLLMAFKGVQDPLYLMQALESVVIAKDKYMALNNLLEEEEIESFNIFLTKAKELKKERNEIAGKGFQDNTEGYIEFISALRNLVAYSY